MKTRIENVLLESPKLRGAQIARKIGVDKSIVNKFLHDNKQFFIQDEDHCWSVAASDDLIVELAADKWIDCESLERSLKAAGSPLDSHLPSVKFLIPKDSGILLEASARLLALCNQLAHAGKIVTLDFSQCIPTLTYLDRIGVFEQLDNKINVIPARPKDNRSLKFAGKSSALVELGSIEPQTQNKQLAVKLTETFVSHSGESYRTVAYTIFTELFALIFMLIKYLFTLSGIDYLIYLLNLREWNRILC